MDDHRSSTWCRTQKYVYSVWFRDDSLPADDQDHEWPACFIVNGTSPASVLAWCDAVSEDYARRRRLSLTSSSLEELGESTLPGLEKLPVLVEGATVTDDMIGW